MAFYFCSLLHFLLCSGATPHVHLPSQHYHDGSQHEHQSEIHTHQFVDDNDSFHHISHVNVIELDTDECLSTDKKQKTIFVALVSTPSFPSPLFSLTRIKPPVVIKAKRSYLDLSTAHPRAPPQIS